MKAFEVVIGLGKRPCTSSPSSWKKVGFFVTTETVLFFHKTHEFKFAVKTGGFGFPPSRSGLPPGCLEKAFWLSLVSE